MSLRSGINLVENPSAGNGIGSRAERDLQKLGMRLRKEQLTLSGLLYFSEKVIDRDLLFTLIQVQDALLRIKFGAYGTCLACGRQVESGRLEMVPWLAYCADCHSKYQQLRTATAGAAVNRVSQPARNLTKKEV